MAANRQQGSSLAALLVGFTALPAGLVSRASYPYTGDFVAVVGALLIVISLIEAYRLKPVELAEDKGGK